MMTDVFDACTVTTSPHYLKEWPSCFLPHDKLGGRCAGTSPTTDGSRVSAEYEKRVADITRGWENPVYTIGFRQNARGGRDYTADIFGNDARITAFFEAVQCPTYRA